MSGFLLHPRPNQTLLELRIYKGLYENAYTQ
jgi:hypothetical protein